MKILRAESIRSKERVLLFCVCVCGGGGGGGVPYNAQANTFTQPLANQLLMPS